MITFKPPYLGAAYYPEDWPLSQIDQDIELMKAAGCNVMRIGEFAWSRMEPREGEFDFDWLHLVVDKLRAAGIATIMGTPTATPPIWLITKYPDCLAVGDSGKPLQHGARRHFCPTSPTYRDFCARIAAKMAEHFGRDEGVIGWQIDNEIYPPKQGAPRGCACNNCVAEFQLAMQRKYGNIDALNAAWGTDLWSMTYQSFDQLFYPRTDTWHHPSLVLNWIMFQHDANIDYCDHQADVLHALVTQPVGTDVMAAPGWDFEKANRKLDLVQFNHYNNEANLHHAAFWMDIMRPLKDRPWWNTETSTCWNGSTAAQGYRDVGFCVANSWLPIALGGEANLYWLWRSHWSGQELMHGSVVSSDGRPLHIFDEVRQISAGYAGAAEFVNNTRPVRTGLAMHFSTLAFWMFETQPMVRDFKYMPSLWDSFYKPMIQAQLRPDGIMPAWSLDDYRVIVSPLLPALDEESLRERLKAWIEAGGTWIAGPLTDNRIVDGTKFTHAPFGSLEEWAGVYCKFEIPGEPRTFNVRFGDGQTSPGAVWYSAFEPRGSETLATYADGPMAGLAAVTRRRMGKGQVIALGTIPSPQALQKLLLSAAGDAGISPVASASDNLLVAPRSGGGGSGMVIVEIENRPAWIDLPAPMRDLLTGQSLSGRVELPAFGVMVLVD